MGSSSRPPNVVTVVLDCARAKNFSASDGDRRAETPEIDALAAAGTTFPRAVAPANWTVPSHFSIFTGTYPSVHGIRTYQKPGEPLNTTATWLRAAGYATSMFTENIHLVGGYGFEEGFDFTCSRRAGVSDEQRTVVNSMFGRAQFLRSVRFRDLLARAPPLVAPLTILFHAQEVQHKREVCGQYTLEAFAKWLGTRSPERPFYAFFNFVDTHDPYDLVPGVRDLNLLERAYVYAPRYYMLAVPNLQSHVRWEALVGGYIKAIEEADRKIGQLVRILEARGERERTLVIITSDHGQSFGEGGNAFHGCGATDSVTRVPLVVSPPRGTSVPRRVERWVSLCEIDSWIKSAARGEGPYDQEGHPTGGRAQPGLDSNFVYCEGGPASDSVRALKGVLPGHSWNHRLLAAYRGGDKFVLDLDTSEVEHWNVVGDADLVAPTRLSRDDATAARRDVFGPYEAEDAARRNRLLTGPSPISVEVDERLRAWGYD